MAALSSRRISADPYPYQAHWTNGSRAGRYARDVSAWIGPVRRCAYEPRPEFDNDANPVLVAFREANASRDPNQGTLREFADRWAHYLHCGAFCRRLIDGVSAVEVAHARRVLARLASA